jgi:D-alanyl-D-alanine carboxypeptidase
MTTHTSKGDAVEEHLASHTKKHFWSAVFIAIVVAGLFCYQEYRLFTLNDTVQKSDAALSSARTQINDVESRLSQLTSESKSLIELLQNEQIKSATFQQEIGKISSTVGVLDKLRNTDKELLQKYSKIYFLNEHYAPTALTTISSEYTYPGDKPMQIHADVAGRLDALLRNANSNGIKLRVVSAFRSFSTQAQLKSNYRVTYGAGTANQFSADQGYSEHQLGTTVDFSTEELRANFEKFESTQAFEWLKQNAYLYGFVLSYPKTNQYYQYEPWHWRFVGVALATRLQNEGKYFYDYDQREIDSYLPKIFDQN